MRLAYVWLLASVLPLTAFAGSTACSSPSSEEVARVGSMQLHLTGVSAGGITYRLRNGQFTVSGVADASFNTEDDPAAPSVQLELPAGNYLIQLSDGWQLERQVAGVFEPVEAVLTSDNPAGFAVLDQQITSVNFAFRAGDDIIELGNGVVDVTISIEDDSCPIGMVACTGICADLDSSPDHCGACGRDCGGGACVSGACQPFALAAGQSFLGELALTDTHVYWASPLSGGSVVRVSKQGGALETLAANIHGGISGNFPPVAVSAAHVYWSNRVSGTLRRANLDGTNAVDVYSFAGFADRIITRENRVYWNDRVAGATDILSLNEGGGAPVVEASFPNPVTTFTEAGGCLYSVVPVNGVSLVRTCPGQASQTLVSGATGLGLAGNHGDDGAQLYFASRDVGVVTLGLNGTTATTITAGQQVAAPIVDGDRLYYIDGSSGGAPACTNNWSLLQVGKTPGSVPTTLIPAPMPCPRQLTMDEDALYWTVEGGGIMKMIKPLP